MQNKMIQGHKRTPIVLNSVAKWTIFLLEGLHRRKMYAHALLKMTRDRFNAIDIA